MLTTKWWERGTYNAVAFDILPFTTRVLLELTPTINSAGTLLRSRFYPSLTLNEEDAFAHSDFNWAQTTVEMVAWYDENGTGFVPQPDDQDARIIATSRLYPTRSATVLNAANSYTVTWAPLQGFVESFGQRKPNIATLVNPQVTAGIWVTGAASIYYGHLANVRWSYGMYGECLFGV